MADAHPLFRHCFGHTSLAQVDGHRFEDKPFFYRFYVDEDKKYKRFWKVRTDGPVPVRWRFQPHTSNNSGLLSLPICEGVQHSFMRADHAAFMHYLREMRALARQRTAEEGGWRISKSRSEEDITTFVQLDDVETIDRQVKCVTVLPLTAAIVARTLLPLSTRPEWDGNQAGPGLLLQELSSLCVCPPGDDCACSRPPPLTGTPPSSLTLDDTGYDSDSDEELLHERVARFISRSSFLSHVFKGVVKRTEESMQYLSIDSLPRLPELEGTCLCTDSCVWCV